MVGNLVVFVGDVCIVVCVLCRVVGCWVFWGGCLVVCWICCG